MNRAVARVTRLPRLPKTTGSSALTLPAFFKDLRGVFAVYKPPHYDLSDLKANLEHVLLSSYDELPCTVDIPLLLPPKENGIIRTDAPDRRYLPSVESRLQRVQRIGLSSRFFPEIDFHSSGLTFCAIGPGQYPEEELFTRYIQRGQTWNIKLLLGVSTGETVHPDHISPDDSKLIVKEGLFTVEGFILGRQNIPNNEKSCRRLLNLGLERIVSVEKYKVMEKYLYEYGPDECYLALSLNNRDWLNEFYSTAVTRAVAGRVVSFSKDTKELEIELQVLGNPTHHFFGVFGDYFTKNALGVNSVVVSSRRVNFGGAKMTKVSDSALTFYELFSIPNIKRSVKATSSYARTIQQRLKAEAMEDEHTYKDLVKEKSKFVSKVRRLEEKVEKNSNRKQGKLLELSRTTTILDHMISSY